MSKDRKQPDPRFSLKTFDGILHTVEDTLEQFNSGILDKGDVSTIGSLLTIARQTISDKSKHAKLKNPAAKKNEPAQELTSHGPYGILRGGKSG